MIAAKSTRSWLAFAIALCLFNLQATSSQDVPNSDNNNNNNNNNSTISKDDLNKLQSDFLGSSADCGRAPINPLSNGRSFAHHMTKGKRQLYGEWPSFARLRGRWGFGTSMCGGVLISDRHVLTAAHCMYDPRTQTTRARADQLTVTMGEDRIDRLDEHEHDFKVSSICVSRNYVKGTPANDYNTSHDYAVLTLRQRVRLNDYRQPACMPDRVPPDSRAICYLVGAGVKYFAPGKVPIFATTVEKQPMVQASCKAWNIPKNDLTRTCWTMRGDKGDSCSGDSGGPILCLDANQRWTVASLVSYGTELCNGPLPFGYTGVYTRIDKLTRMIRGECQVD